jgi:hypothetical protein
MAYNKTTDFAAKDALPAGDTNKIVRGSEINAEFVNIQSAFSSVNSELSSLSSVATSGAYSDLSGTPTIPSAQSTAYSAVGTYIQGYHYIGAVPAAGGTFPGSSLRSSTAAGTRWSAAAGAALPGTWRLMGEIYKGGSTAEATAVWVRIS